MFFNHNGQAHYGLADWLKIWAHYRTRIAFLRAGGSGTIRITVRGDMALVTDDHVGRHWTWIGPNQPNMLISHPYIRASLVLLREPVGWRVIHAHFSSSRPGLRPDQGGDE